MLQHSMLQYFFAKLLALLWSTVRQKRLNINMAVMLVWFHQYGYQYH